MIILGIDPGLERTGFGVIEQETGGHAKLLDFGCIITDRASNVSFRLASLAADLTELILRWKPHVAVVEEIFFSKNVKTAMVVSQARGVILEILEEMGVPSSTIKPQQVKIAVSGHGKSDKKQMKKMVEMLLGMKEPIKSDDAADAIACAIAYAPPYES